MSVTLSPHHSYILSFINYFNASVYVVVINSSSTSTGSQVDAGKKYEFANLDRHRERHVRRILLDRSITLRPT